MADFLEAGQEANKCLEQKYEGLDHAVVMRDQRIQSAIWAISEYRRITTDADLMADVRAWIREKRDELSAVLDDIG